MILIANEIDHANDFVLSSTCGNMLGSSFLAETLSATRASLFLRLWSTKKTTMPIIASTSARPNAWAVGAAATSLFGDPNPASPLVEATPTALPQRDVAPDCQPPLDHQPASGLPTSVPSVRGGVALSRGALPVQGPVRGPLPPRKSHFFTGHRGTPFGLTVNAA